MNLVLSPKLSATQKLSVCNNLCPGPDFRHRWSISDLSGIYALKMHWVKSFVPTVLWHMKDGPECKHNMDQFYWWLDFCVGSFRPCSLFSLSFLSTLQRSMWRLVHDSSNTPWYFPARVPGPHFSSFPFLQVQDRVWERCRWCSWWHEVLRKIAAAKKPRQGCSALASECVFVWGGALDLLPLQEWWRRRWRAPRGCQSDVLLWWSCCCCTPLLSAPQSRTGE